MLNAEDYTDVQRAMDIAFKYRNYFRKDIIVDLIVYRRWYVPHSPHLRHCASSHVVVVIDKNIRALTDSGVTTSSTSRRSLSRSCTKRSARAAQSPPCTKSAS